VLRREIQDAAQAQPQWQRLLVPAVDRPFSVRCLEVAFRLIQGTGGVVHLVYVLEVPRTLALEASLPEFEMVADDALRVAQQTALPFKVLVQPYIHRTRSAQEGILRLITQEKIDLLVLGGRPDGNRGLSSDLSRELFQRSPCEVVFDYIAGEK
jgi:nucleotide-binding universal stress UspA family protein